MVNIKKLFLHFYDKETRNFLRDKEKIKNPYSVKFNGINLSIHPHVWNPNWGLSTKIVVNHLKINQGDKVLDIGTGSGALAIIASRKGASHVLAIDKNKYAVKCAKYNIKLNKLNNKIKVRYSNLFSNVKSKFDVILFNPPQRTIKPETILESACFDYKMRIMKRFINEVKEILKFNGRIYLSYGNAGEISQLEKLLKENSFKFKLLDKRRLGLKIYRIYEIKL